MVNLVILLVQQCIAGVYLVEEMGCQPYKCNDNQDIIGAEPSLQEDPGVDTQDEEDRYNAEEDDGGDE